MCVRDCPSIFLRLFSSASLLYVPAICLTNVLLASPHERKRKRYAIVDCEDPRRDQGDRPQKKAISIGSNGNGTEERAEQPADSHSSGQPITPEETLDYVQNALVAQFGGGNEPRASLSSPKPSDGFEASAQYTPSRAAGYLGRSSYLGGELLDQEDATHKESTHVPHSSLTADDIKVLEIRTAFDLPTRATCESLISTFMTKCDPWMPVLSSSVLESLRHGDVAEVPLLLLQAVLMAGA